MKAYINAKIYTMDNNNPRATYFIEDEGKIFEIGNDFVQSKYYALISEENIFDMKGSIITPGFWESHLHIIDGLRSLMEINMRTVGSLQKLKATIVEYAQSLRENDWIIGHGWDEQKNFSGKFPNRYILDELHSEHPMMLIRMDGHSVCFNTKALELAKIAEHAPSNEIPFDESGVPSGMVYENAANDAVNKIAEGFSDEYIEKLVLKAQELFVQNGITSVNDIYTMHSRYFNIYSKLQKEGKLNIRITTAPYGLDEKSLEEYDQCKGDESDRLRIGAPKLFIDGSFGSRTALLTEAYADAPCCFGIQVIEKEKLKEIILQNESINQPVNIHAIGDRAVNIALDCIEETRIDNQRDIRIRIEHIQIVQDSDIERFKKLDVTASFQPVFLYENELTEARLGKSRVPMIYRFRSFINQRINVIFNSDFPYGGGDMPAKKDNSAYIGFEPILGIHAACYRQLNPPEAVTPKQALQCYTSNAAFANYREKELGMLKKGYLADFIVISEDILTCSPEQLLNAEVLQTYINGEMVYQR